MELRIGTAFLFLCCITAIKCWVELDIAGDDFSNPNPKFVKPDDDCNTEPEPEPGCGGDTKPAMGRKGGQRGRGKKGREKPDPEAEREIDEFSENMDKQKAQGKGKQRALNDESGQEADASQDDSGPSGGQDGGPNGGQDGGPSVIETPQKPRIRMIKRKKEKGKEKVERQVMEATECTEIIDMEPKTSIKIETYTIPYNHKTVTRKVVYIQRRRKIKRTIQKQILVIKRKVIKDRQFFERIIPKVVETREIINKPKVSYKVIEGPMEPMDGPDDGDEDCDENAAPMDGGPYGPGNGRNGNGPGYDPNCDTNPGYNAPPYNNGPGYAGYPQQNYDSNGIHVGYDFASALNTGLQAAFNAPHVGEVVAPNMRYLGDKDCEVTTPCPPGMVDNGQGPNSGGNSYDVYGQPVPSFQKRI